MSKRIVASVQSLEMASAEGQPAANPLVVGDVPTRVILDGSSYLIDREDPRYRPWTELLLRRERSGKPVYVEVEPAGAAGERITRLEVPRLRRVAEIFPVPEGEVFGVRLAGSPLLLHLPFDRPEDLATLRSAREQDYEVLITSDPETDEVLDVRPFAAPEERLVRLGGLLFPPFPGPLTEILTVRQVLGLFDFLARQPEIPFDFPRDCCTARAHAMFGLLRSRGFRCRKIWSYGGGGVANLSRMKFFTLRDARGFVPWSMHVAPLVRVRLGSGTVVEMVLDPSMFSRPARVEEWVALQHDSNAVQQVSEPDLLEREFGGASPRTDPRFLHTLDCLDDHIAIRNRLPVP